MSENFVYITSTQDGRSYGLRSRNSVQGYQEDLEMMGSVGDKLVKSFRVPFEIVGQTIEACSEFVEGKLSLNDLEERVASLRK